MACADDRIKEIGEQMDSLTNLANNASDFASSAMDEMRDCIDQNQTSPNMMAMGQCLTSVAMKVEMRGAVFVTQSGLQVRVRLFIYNMNYLGDNRYHTDGFKCLMCDKESDTNVMLNCLGYDADSREIILLPL